MKRSTSHKLFAVLVAVIMILLPLGGLSALATDEEPLFVTYRLGSSMAALANEYPGVFPYDDEVYYGEDYALRSITQITGTSLPDGWTFLYWTFEGGQRQPGYECTIYDNMTAYAVGTYQTPPTPPAMTVNVTFTDTWNEVSTTVNNVSVPGTGTVTAADVASIAPAYWISSTTQVTNVTAGSTITFNGSKFAEYNATTDVYSAYTTGDRYQCITTVAGFLKIDDTAAGMQTATARYWQLNDLDLSAHPTNTVMGTQTFYRVCTIGGYGNSPYTFNGIYDGGNHNITGFGQNSSYMNGSNDNYLGLFSVNQGTLKNFNLTVTTLQGATRVGAVAGQNSGTIKNVHVTISNVLSSYSNTTDFSTSGIVKASAIGGITGVSQGTNSLISNCSVLGDINGYAFSNDRQSGGSVGGICGIQLAGTIDKCWYNGSINAAYAAGYAGNNIGGIVGATFGAISNCWAFVDYINGYDFEGGIAGNAGASSVISTCWAYVLDGGTWNGYYIGSIVTSSCNCTVSYCYYETDDCIGYGKGTATTFGGTTPLTGFDTTIWEFVDGYFPGLISNPT